MLREGLREIERQYIALINPRVYKHTSMEILILSRAYKSRAHKESVAHSSHYDQAQPYLFSKVSFIVKPLNQFTPIVRPFAKNSIIIKTTPPFTTWNSHEPILLAHSNYKAFHRSFTHFCKKFAFTNKFTTLSSDVCLMMLDAQKRHTYISFIKSERKCSFDSIIV